MRSRPKMNITVLDNPWAVFRKYGKKPRSGYLRDYCIKKYKSLERLPLYRDYRVWCMECDSCCWRWIAVIHPANKRDMFSCPKCNVVYSGKRVLPVEDDPNG